MGIGIQDQFGPCNPSQTGNMTVGQTMPLSGAYLKEHSVGSRHFYLLRSEQTGMSQDIDVLRLEGSGIGTGLYRLGYGLPVNHDNHGSKFFGASGCFSNRSRRYMGQLYSRKGYYVPVSPGNFAIPGDLSDDPLEGTEAYMIGEGDASITLHRSPADEFKRRESTVAQARVGMEVVDGTLPQNDL